MSLENPLHNRLLKNYKKLAPWAKESKIEAYRLYKKDIPEFPYLIDIYKDHCVIYEQGLFIDQDSPLSEVRDAHLKIVHEALMTILNIPISHLILKTRLKDKGGEQYGKIDMDKKSFSINEGPLKFEVNLTQYLDTGLFLDHRPLRKKLLKESNGKKVLNLFSYTGSLSVASAIGGAIEVTSVDLSKTYQNWAKRNFELNGLDSSYFEFIEGETQDVLEDLIHQHIKYDLIILDPPTFSNSKKMNYDFEIEKDHEGLIHQCMKLLAHDGVLYFSTNKKKFKLSPRIENMATIRDWTHLSIPLDFKDSRIHQSFELKHKFD